MKNSSIQWCNHTYNPWLGCRKVAPECENCYIVRQTPLRVRNIKHGSERHRCGKGTLEQPLRWNAQAEIGLKLGTMRERPRVFCLSLGDWLDNEVPIEWLADLLRMIHDTPNLDWLLLTKRPQNWQKRVGAINNLHLAAQWINGHPPYNVWIGVSAGADGRAALNIPAKIHFLSCEPMLRPLDNHHLPNQEFDWIIFGGESLPGGEPRSTDTEWIRGGIEFCKRNNVAPFVKQLGGRPKFGGSWFPVSNAHGDKMEEWPEDLRVRDFPKT